MIVKLLKSCIAEWDELCEFTKDTFLGEKRFSIMECEYCGDVRSIYTRGYKRAVKHLLATTLWVKNSGSLYCDKHSSKSSRVNVWKDEK